MSLKSAILRLALPIMILMAILDALVSTVPTWILVCAGGGLLIVGALFITITSNVVNNASTEGLEYFKNKLRENPGMTKSHLMEFKEEIRKNRDSDEAHRLGWYLYNSGMILDNLIEQMENEVKLYEDKTNNNLQEKSNEGAS